jgi:hypothetical protein
MCSARAVRRLLERREPNRWQRRDLRPRVERPAPEDLDVRRRRRPSDLPGPRALRRGSGRFDRSRDAIHRGLHPEHVRLARASPGRGEEQELPAHGCAVPAERQFQAGGFQRRRQGDPYSDEALRYVRRRQRQRLVLSGDDGSRLDQRPARPAENHPRVGVPGRRRVGMQGSIRTPPSSSTARAVPLPNARRC